MCYGRTFTAEDTLWCQSWSILDITHQSRELTESERNRGPVDIFYSYPRKKENEEQFSHRLLQNNFPFLSRKTKQKTKQKNVSPGNVVWFVPGEKLGWGRCSNTRHPILSFIQWENDDNNWWVIIYHISVWKRLTLVSIRISILAYCSRYSLGTS